MDVRDPRALFLFCIHNKTSPRLRILQPQTVDQTLEEAARDYCYRRIIVGSKYITLPAIFFWWKDDLFQKESKIHPFLGLPWLTVSQIKGILKLLQNGPLRFNYKYDWTPHPKPIIV